MLKCPCIPLCSTNNHWKLHVTNSYLLNVANIWVSDTRNRLNVCESIMLLPTITVKYAIHPLDNVPIQFLEPDTHWKNASIIHGILCSCRFPTCPLESVAHVSPVTSSPSVGLVMNAMPPLQNIVSSPNLWLSTCAPTLLLHYIISIMPLRHWISQHRLRKSSHVLLSTLWVWIEHNKAPLNCMWFQRVEDVWVVMGMIKNPCGCSWPILWLILSPNLGMSTPITCLTSSLRNLLASSNLIVCSATPHTTAYNHVFSCLLAYNYT